MSQFAFSKTKPTQSEAVLLSFSGIDGAGKSTQIDKLCAAFSVAHIPVTRLAFWDDVVVFSRLRASFSHKFLHSEGGVGAPEKPVNRNDKNARRWYLTLGRSILYLLDALHLARVVARTRNNHPRGVIISDRYIYDQLATLPLERPMARTYVRFIMKLVPVPDVAYLLDAKPEAARARTPEYPVEFLHQYRRSYLQLCDLLGLALIKPLSQEEAYLAITQRLEGCSDLRELLTSDSSLASA